jgi:hypothetical protein
LIQLLVEMGHYFRLFISYLGGLGHCLL